MIYHAGVWDTQVAVLLFTDTNAGGGVSEFFNGKLSSGANESIYACGSITIIITVSLIILLSIYNAFITRKRQFSKVDP